MRRRRTSLRALFGFALLCLVFSGNSYGAPSPVEELTVLKGKILKEDSKGQSVLVLQRVLGALGYDPGPQDGVFGPRTLEAVKRFQKDSGIAVDGVVGPRTVESLERIWARKFPPETYTLQPGETLSLVCARFGVSLEEVVRANGIKDPDLVYAGQTLILKPSAREQPGQDGQGGPGGPERPMPEDSSEPPPASRTSFPIPDKKICLTFNDGPDPTTTPEILDILSEYGIPAVFFVIGKNAERYPELVREIHERGYAIGIHGYEHVPLAGLSRQQALSDLSKALQVVERITAARPALWRPPEGAVDDMTRDLTRELDLTLVMWTNICGGDLPASDADGVLRGVLNYARDGAIILLHEGNPHVLAALPRIIEELAKRGFGFQGLR
ncbi:MAG TPA: polysaccharide deacetylase family protein [Firmicutes bacterium]|nr:polysaccharide deacetylase family protein [Candidatus Fermentithermobacillaceae bacterium]